MFYTTAHYFTHPEYGSPYWGGYSTGLAEYLYDYVADVYELYPDYGPDYGTHTYWVAPYPYYDYSSWWSYTEEYTLWVYYGTYGPCSTLYGITVCTSSTWYAY